MLKVMVNSRIFQSAALFNCLLMVVQTLLTNGFKIVTLLLQLLPMTDWSILRSLLEQPQSLLVKLKTSISTKILLVFYESTKVVPEHQATTNMPFFLVVVLMLFARIHATLITQPLLNLKLKVTPL